MKEIYTALDFRVVRFKKNDLIVTSPATSAKEELNVDGSGDVPMRKRNPLDKLNDLLN